jgi:hypothetical protein
VDADRYCDNCRAPLPAGATHCEKCGVYVGDVFDGKMPRAPLGRPVSPLTLVILLAAAGFGAWWLWLRPPPPKFDTGPVRVLRGVPGASQRPKGAKLNQAEATRALRRFLAVEKSECLAVISRGYRDGIYIFKAVNRCAGKPLGDWEVDAKTEKVSRKSL